MKVRWREDSLRLRITPGELAALVAGEWVGEGAVFPGSWSVRLGLGEESTLTAPQPGALVVTLSADDRDRLAEPEREGVYFTTESYRFFIEKDFPCAHPRPKEAQEATETFAPPPGFADRHKTTCS